MCISKICSLSGFKCIDVLVRKMLGVKRKPLAESAEGVRIELLPVKGDLDLYTPPAHPVNPATITYKDIYASLSTEFANWGSIIYLTEEIRSLRELKRLPRGLGC